MAVRGAAERWRAGGTHTGGVRPRRSGAAGDEKADGEELEAVAYAGDASAEAWRALREVPCGQTWSQ